MANLNTSYGHIEHASTCACVLDNQDDCNCFFSALAKTSIFRAANTQGPSGDYGSMDEQAQGEIRQFVTTKRTVLGEQLLQRKSPVKLYQPLLDGEIRVLELQPGAPGAPLRGTLHIVSIDFFHSSRSMNSGSLTWSRQTNHALSLTTGSPVWYTALSYTWGAPVFDRTIAFEQGDIAITSSLASALQHLRSESHGVFLWIDQICINQPDTAEKIQQIPLMGQIYRRATNTFIWLGDDDGCDSVLAFDALETIYARLQSSEAQITTADFQRLNFPPETDRSWWAIRQLFRRPWLTRLWTIQEAVLSRNLFLACGKAVACWDDFAAWCYQLGDSGLLQWIMTNDALDEAFPTADDALLRPPRGGLVINSIQADRLQNQNFVQEYLLNILVSTRYAQAWEPKDKIYGVLGLAEVNVKLDYSPQTSAREIYHQACLTQLPSLTYELLSCIDHDTPLIPSWIPDWSVPRVTQALGYSTRAWNLYHAGGRNNGKPGKYMLSDNEAKLTLSGKIFDEIKHLGRVSQDPRLDIDDAQVGNRDIISYLDLLQSTHSHDNYPAPNITPYHAFLQTLAAGRDRTAVSPISQDHSEVFSLILDASTGQHNTPAPSLRGQEATYTPRRKRGFFTLNSLRTRKPAKTLEDLNMAMIAAMKMRRFIVTEKGYYALVPRGAREGDQIVVFEGACVPFAIRRLGVGKQEWEMLGEAYVHGIMHGEVLGVEGLEWQDVTIV
ncbi:HET-domain-containing protein [Plenodomus tracheiphilus IPT5]|uniref:HET-domain-containing protein n=1 Tax=Plenodomus tracheiphilus IPT5 TaxID=1408161 RepID=A0A6A7API8_9PLEO|nr:HET-domain-containing protein [Plenodomus tracheiphilus IPT5]